MGKSRKPGLCEYFQEVPAAEPGCQRGLGGDLAKHRRTSGAGSLPGASDGSRPKEGFFSSHYLLSSSKLLWASSCRGAGSRRSAVVGTGAQR